LTIAVVLFLGVGSFAALQHGVNMALGRPGVKSNSRKMLQRTITPLKHREDNANDLKNITYSLRQQPQQALVLGPHERWCEVDGGRTAIWDILWRRSRRSHAGF
jgi:hypothetical protein